VYNFRPSLDSVFDSVSTDMHIDVIK